jgi:LEA14-like dessication related protein
MTHFKLCAALPLVLISLACSAVKQPTATFQSMNVTDVTSAGFTMAFALDLQNPNAVALPISQADYKIGFAGVNVLDGKATPAGTIPANGSIPVKLPVTVTFENLLAAEKAIVSGGGKVPYAFNGSMKFDTSAAGGGDNMLSKALGGGASVPLKYEGTLDVKSLVQNPQVLMNSPAAKKLAQQLLGSMFGR